MRQSLFEKAKKKFKLWQWEEGLAQRQAKVCGEDSGLDLTDDQQEKLSRKAQLEAELQQLLYPPVEVPNAEAPTEPSLEESVVEATGEETSADSQVEKKESLVETTEAETSADSQVENKEPVVETKGEETSADSQVDKKEPVVKTKRKETSADSQVEKKEPVVETNGKDGSSSSSSTSSSSTSSSSTSEVAVMDDSQPKRGNRAKAKPKAEPKALSKAKAKPKATAKNQPTPATTVNINVQLDRGNWDWTCNRYPHNQNHCHSGEDNGWTPSYSSAWTWSGNASERSSTWDDQCKMERSASWHWENYSDVVHVEPSRDDVGEADHPERILGDGRKNVGEVNHPWLPGKSSNARKRQKVYRELGY